jgi:hypothetical protein
VLKSKKRMHTDHRPECAWTITTIEALDGARGRLVCRGRS